MCLLFNSRGYQHCHNIILKEISAKSGYYTLPLSYSRLMEQQEHPRCELKESVAQYIHLVATTYLGECRFDASFGCSIWDYDFINAMTDVKLRDTLKKSLLEAIGKNEKRLNKLEVSVMISQVELSANNSRRMKKRIDVRLQARLVKTDEPFQYYEFFFLGPLSYY